MCSDICPRTYPVPRSEQFFDSVALGNCELRGTGQLSEHISARNGGYCVYYPSNVFRNMRGFENWRISQGHSPVLAREYSVELVT